MIRQSSGWQQEENRVRGGASHQRWHQCGGGAQFPVRTKALQVVSLDKRQRCNEEVLFCHKNPQECGARVSSPTRSFGGGKELDDVAVGRSLMVGSYATEKIRRRR
jgi:hypothetical protein